ncbi:MAG: DUF309 domain-containing protein [Acidobacteriota bacterium]
MPRIRKKSLSELDLSTLHEFELLPQEKETFLRGIALFNAGRFWEAHEAWEEIWLNHPEDGRFFIQALIQLAAGYHQLRRGIRRGFSIHLRRACDRLQLFPPDFLGVNAAELYRIATDSLARLENHSDDAEAVVQETVAPRIVMRKEP